MKLLQRSAVGWLVVSLLVLHAAMLAGGGHSADAHSLDHQSSHHMMHGQMAGPEMALVASDTPQVQMPEMAECAMLGAAILRVEMAVASETTESALPALRELRVEKWVYAPRAIAITRAQLQIFRI